jgi:hypothetical protein
LFHFADAERIHRIAFDSAQLMRLCRPCHKSELMWRLRSKLAHRAPLLWALQSSRSQCPFVSHRLQPQSLVREMVGLAAQGPLGSAVLSHSYSFTVVLHLAVSRCGLRARGYLQDAVQCKGIACAG